MKAVYANSSCNISALGSSNRLGCFVRRNPLVWYPCLLPVVGDVNIVADEVRGPSDMHWGTTELETAELFKRAWVFQERLLPSRSVCFGKRELYWECCEHNASERWPEGIPRNLMFPHKKEFRKMLRYIPRLGETNRKDFSYAWHLLVDMYTSLELTYPSDRIVAFSGVASTIQEATGLTYIAGIWKELLPHELMWSRERVYDKNEGRPTWRPSPWRAPSWSWASLEGPVTHILGDGVLSMTTSPIPYLVEVVDYQITPILDRTTALGEVSGAVLTLRGFVKQARWHRQNGSLTAPYYANFERGLGCAFTPDVEAELTEGAELAFFLVACIDNRSEREEALRNNKSYHGKDYTETGLVLTQYSGVRNGYVRRGWFNNGGSYGFLGNNVFLDGEVIEERTIHIY
ncbi:hypothetical protein DL765_011130 [Monosporascus sp. GIB2]|nr:hypothetical protein DL765_011130 [Monosporascus sp. GIB2]